MGLEVGEGGTEKEEENEKIPLYGSIGHQTLRRSYHAPLSSSFVTIVNRGCWEATKSIPE